MIYDVKIVIFQRLVMQEYIEFCSYLTAVGTAGPQCMRWPGQRAFLVPLLRGVGAGRRGAAGNQA